MLILGGGVIGCKNRGIQVFGSAGQDACVLLGVKAFNTPTGLYYGYNTLTIGCAAYGCSSMGLDPAEGQSMTIACSAVSCGTGFYIYANEANVYACYALKNTVGFHVTGSAVSGNPQRVTLQGNYACDNTTAGFRVADDPAYCYTHVLLANNFTRKQNQPQTYAFYFGRALNSGKLSYIGNWALGYGTAAEYWHPDLISSGKKAEFEIAHNIVA
jgi:hypothetical protein